jgi:DNA-binding FrmR family transcriptional regulator
MSATAEPATAEPVTAEPVAQLAFQDAQAQKRISHRMRRARGQLDAVIAAVDANDPCRDIVIQLAAVTSALNRAGFAIVSTALKECLATPEATRTDRDFTPEEIEKLFMMLA